MRSAASTARRRSRAGAAVLPARAAGDERGEPVREHEAGFVDADVAAPGRGGLCELAEDHELGQRRHASGMPEAFALARSADVERFDCVRRKVERQALVAAIVVLVRADEFVAGMPDQHRARDELERAAAAAVAEAAAAHVGDRERTVHFGKRQVVRARVAPIVDDSQRVARE